MLDDLTGKWGLFPIELVDQTKLNAYLSTLAQPLSDYTFSQIFTWRNSMRLLWREIDRHLCVFANGSGDLTLLLPPIAGDGAPCTDAVLKQAFELMDEYNHTHGVPDRSRVEYVSAELMNKLDRRGLSVAPMGHDYVYDTKQMIELAGGDLKSKRQEKNRFMRNYTFRVETYQAVKHLSACLALLDSWKVHQDANHLDEANTNSIKRQKETFATELALRHATELGLTGMVVYIKDDNGESIRGFTFGERLGTDQASIVIEKTDLSVKGLAQFIFSEFCRVHWADVPLINAGDDWGLETLAWTKASYRPVKMLEKFVLRKDAVTQSGTGFQPVRVAHGPEAHATVRIRVASKSDLIASRNLEESCFDTYCLSRRQLQYLQRSPNSVFHVAEENGELIGQGIALIRHHKNSLSGRLYSLAVRNDQRGKGIGQRLLDAVLNSLTERGARRVYLEVEQTNAAAIGLYERQGFRSLDVLKDYYGDGRDGVHMMCELQAKLPKAA